MFRLSTKSPFHLGGGREAPLDQQIRWLRREREPRKTPAEGGKTNEKRKQTGKMKTNPPHKPNSPPERKLTTPKQSLRERERAPWRENCPCSQCIVVKMRAASRQEFPLQIEEKPLALPRRFATRLRGGTSWRRAVRADGRVCCRKRQLATDRQLTTVWQVATSDSRQRATCNVQLCKLVLASIINCNCNCNNNLCNAQSVWQLTTLC